MRNGIHISIRMYTRWIHQDEHNEEHFRVASLDMPDYPYQGLCRDRSCQYAAIIERECLADGRSRAVLSPSFLLHYRSSGFPTINTLSGGPTTISDDRASDLGRV